MRFLLDIPIGQSTMKYLHAWGINVRSLSIAALIAWFLWDAWKVAQDWRFLIGFCVAFAIGIPSLVAIWHRSRGWFTYIATFGFGILILFARFLADVWSLSHQSQGLRFLVLFLLCALPLYLFVVTLWTRRSLRNKELHDPSCDP